MPATARLDMRLQPSLKQAAERAAMLAGARSLTEFVVQAIREKTEMVLEEKTSIRISCHAFDQFMTAGEQPNSPSAPLKQAASHHDKQGFG